MKKSSNKNTEFPEMNREALENYYQTNLDAWREIMELSFKYNTLWQEYFNSQTQRLSTAKDMSDVIATESGLATEYASKFNETNRRLYETITKSMEKQMNCLNLPTDMDIKSLMPFPMDWESFSKQKK